MMKDAALVIDIGTGSSRIAIVSLDKEIVALKAFVNSYYIDKQYDDAKFFLPNEFKEKIFSIIKELISETDYHIKFITSSAARESIVLVDEDGNDYYGLPNIDNRGKKWISTIPNREYIEKYTGRPLTEDFGALKLYGLKERPELYSKLAKITSLSDWIGYLLTGNIEMEFSQACETQLFNIYKKEWDQSICESFGILHDILPKVVSAGTIYSINPQVQKEMMLDDDCVYVVGGADTQLAAKGMDLSEDDIGLISGTSSPVVKYKDSIPDYEENEDFNFWCGCNLSGNGYQIETNPGVTGLNFQLAKDIFLPDSSYQEIDDYIVNHYNDLKCLASFTTQSPYKNVAFPNGGFYMNVPFNQSLKREDFIHAVVVDIAFAITFKIRQNEVLSQTNSPYIVGSGGGLRLSSLCQLIADMTGKKLVLKDNFNEASVIGGALICFETNPKYEKQQLSVIEEFLPNRNEYLRKRLEEWILHREKDNSKKEIGEF